MSPVDNIALITGGAGFIGSHLVERLVEAGYGVVNLDLLTYAGNPANLSTLDGNARHVFVRGDIGDRSLVRSLLAKHQPQVVFNLAAESHVDRSIDRADPFIETNMTGVYRLLEVTLAYWRGLDAERQRTFRYIQMSTDEVYGSIADGVFTEESNYTPNSPYAASKAAGDHLTRAFGATYGLPVCIVHASNTYGPRQYPAISSAGWSRSWPRRSRARSIISPAAKNGRISIRCARSAGISTGTRRPQNRTPRGSPSSPTGRDTICATRWQATRSGACSAGVRRFASRMGFR